MTKNSKTTDRSLNNQERLAVMEQRFDENDRGHERLEKGQKETDSKIQEISIKLDAALDNKADKAEVERLDKRFWWLISIFVGGFISMVVYIIQAGI